MRALGLAALALAVAACGSYDSQGQPGTDAPQPGGDASSCGASISYTPATPIAPVTVHATASVPAPGVLTYTWSVARAGTAITFTQDPQDGSQIDFTADQGGIYDVGVSVDGPVACNPGVVHVPVMAPGANTVDYRVRVWPPATLAPTQEQVVAVHGGADMPYPVTLDPGVPLAGTITNGTTGIPAYVRFMPVAHPDAYVETFSASDGSFAVRLLGQPHQVLIVPAVAGLAPAIVPWSLGTTTLAVGPGTAVTGTVTDGAGAALAGATVQLASGGVPSSLATTAANGTFTVHAAFAAGAPVTATIVPPPGRGLPRLTATGALDLTKALQIRYAAVATCDLAGTAVTRGGAAQPGAHVTLVGTLAAAAGTVTAGTTSASATGTVAIAATADATGHLPSTLAPKAPLSAVVGVASGELAVAALDLTAGPPAAIAAPAGIAAAGTAVDPAQAPLAGVLVQASPAGPLAAAGASALETASGSGGTYQLVLASGGSYDLRYVDPLGRAAPLVVTGATPATVPATAMLAPALHLSGTVSVSGSANPVAGASIQVLCGSCTGLDAERPIAETATDATSAFRVAVPDPGTM